MLKLDVNGIPQHYAGDPAMPLLWFLRDIANLTGTS
jgi:isoquinoline 1-oxidoreductase alpha subunit